MLSESLLARVPVVLQELRARGWKLVTAESCTGGLIAAALTSVAGSSDVVERGFVTYSNESKTELLGVPAALIATHGAVSAEVAFAMAEGALARSHADIAISVTGVAGPGGGTAEKPVGFVWFGCAIRRGCVETTSHLLPDGRAEVRSASVGVAFDMLSAYVAASWPT